MAYIDKLKEEIGWLKVVFKGSLRYFDCDCYFSGCLGNSKLRKSQPISYYRRGDSGLYNYSDHYFDESCRLSKDR